jgi:hypothetical protein
MYIHIYSTIIIIFHSCLLSFVTSEATILTYIALAYHKCCRTNMCFNAILLVIYQIARLSLRPATTTASCTSNATVSTISTMTSTADDLMIKQPKWQQLDGGLQLVINRYLRTILICKCMLKRTLNEMQSACQTIHQLRILHDSHILTC